MEKINCSRLEENQPSLGRLLVTNIVARVSYINYEIKNVVSGQNLKVSKVNLHTYLYLYFIIAIFL